MTTFEEKFEAACHEGAIPGAVLAASNADGSFQYMKAFQGRNLRESADSNYRIDSVLRLASCSKLITSVAALQCVDKGLIGLDDDVSRWLPEFKELKVLLECEDGKEPVFEDLQAPITLRLLLTHSAGFGMGILEPHLARYRERTGQGNLESNDGTIFGKFFCPLIAQPGAIWNYASGHDWACKVVEKVTGTTLEDFVQANICSPLGITTMTFWLERCPDLLKKKLQASKRGKDGKELKAFLTGGVDDPNAPVYSMPESLDRNYKECFGGEGWSASMPDYLKMLHSLLANDEKLLKRESVEQLFSAQLSPSAKATLNQGFQGAFASIAPGTYPNHIDLTWGLGAMLSMQDDLGWRSKGTLSWSGMANLWWFIDRGNVLCGIFGTQMLPSGDDKTRELTLLWEKEMYRLAAATRT